MKKPLILALAFLVSCGQVTKEELDSKFADIEKRLDRIEAQQKKLEEQNIRTEARLDSTVENLTNLRLEVEKLKSGRTHSPISKLPDLPKQETVEGTKQQQETKPIAQQDYQKEYEDAVKLYDLRQLNQARDRFIEYIKKYPNVPLTDNAYFWLGVVYRDLGEYNKAEAVWLTLVEKCKRKELVDCNKAPSAYLQLARVYEQRGEWTKANEFYDSIIKEYPISDEAETARKRLGR